MHDSYLSIIKVALFRSRKGMRRLLGTPVGMAVLLVYIAVTAACWGLLSIPTADVASSVIRALYRTLFPFVALAAGISLPVLIGTPKGSHRMRTALYEAGIVNHDNAAPYLLERSISPQNPSVLILLFYSANIAQQNWVEHKEKVEAAIGSTIIKIEYVDTTDYVRVYAAQAGVQLPLSVPWSKEHLPDAPTVFALGQSLIGPYEVDVSVIPHLLLAGETGSGKSQLLKLLLAQALTRGNYDVIIIDYKGGVDYGRKWRSRCQMCFDTDGLIAVLDDICREIDSRMALFHKADCANLREYNSKTADKLRGIILAFDELAEATDANKCLGKADKERVTHVIGQLSKIARLSRFADIHLFTATQSPLVDVLPSQIRNNLGFRAIGRCDDNLSRVVIGNPDAATDIPKDVPGRFLTNDGTIIQAYLFSDSMLLEEV